MANQYFVFREMPELGTAFVIENRDAAHHIFTVMRANVGDQLQVAFDGGKIGLVEVVSADEYLVQLIEELSVLTELPVKITIAVGFPKGDKLDFITEKATELGAASVWAAPFKWSVAKWDAKKLAKKQEKLEKIALGAAEQSRRQVVPRIELFGQLSALTERFDEFDAVCVAYEESAKAGERAAFAQVLMQQPRKLLIIFGPEGGIAPEEIERFEAGGAKLIGLGPRILRAETAPLYALSAVSAYLELFK